MDVHRIDHPPYQIEWGFGDQRIADVAVLPRFPNHAHAPLTLCRAGEQIPPFAADEVTADGVHPSGEATEDVQFQFPWEAVPRSANQATAFRVSGRGVGALAWWFGLTPRRGYDDTIESAIRRRFRVFPIASWLRFHRGLVDDRRDGPKDAKEENKRLTG